MKENKSSQKKNRTIRSELLWLLSITSLSTMIMVGVILSSVFFRQSFLQAKEDMDFYMESIHNELVSHIRFIEETVISIRQSPKWEDFFIGREADITELKHLLEEGTNLFGESNVIKGVYPVVKDLYIFNSNLENISSHFYPLSVAEKSSQIRKCQQILQFIDVNEQFKYFSYGDSIEMYVALYDDDLLLKGYLVAILSTGSIEEIYKQLGRYEDYHWTLYDKEHQFLAGDSLFQKESIQLHGMKGIGKVGKKEYMYHIENMSFGLSSYILVPKTKLFRDIERGFKLAWIISVSVFIMVFLVMFYVSKELTKPLRTIVHKMKQVGKGDFDTRLGEYNIYEFQEFSQSFNEMVGKIDHLIKEVYEAELLVKEARIQYLQAQINPHFLFNVLSMIAIRLKKNEDEDLYRLVMAFAGLMQGKLFRKNEIEIPLKEEMEIAEFYLYLSGERFKDRVSYEIKWESEDLKDCMIPRLSVEPIVENAMIHGLEPKSSRGKILVNISQKNEKELIIVVKDDGIGFDMENMINSEEKKSPRTGVMNIQRLIHNLYGDDYGVDMFSKVGEGTEVRLRLPFSKKKMI